MDDDTSSTLLLELAWPLIDVKSQGFIYAKDFPLLLSKMEELLNRGKLVHERVPLISKTGQEITKKFGNDQEFFKVYKDDFKELFDGLIGISFKVAVDACIDDGTLNTLKSNYSRRPDPSNPIGTRDMSSLPGEIGSFNKQVSDLDRHEGRKEKDIDAGNDIFDDFARSRDPIYRSPTSIRRATNMQANVASLKKELDFKDDIIREKDRELLNLTKKVSEYKDKYGFLGREFNFYKDHAETRNLEGCPDTTKHDFIISELKRKIDEQTVVISHMRSQFPPKSNLSLGETTQNFIAKKVPFYLGFKLFLVLFLLLLSGNIITAFLRFLMSTSSSRSPSASSPVVRLRWWEQNSLLSKLHWFFTDAFDEFGVQEPYNERIDASYEKLFGI